MRNKDSKLKRIFLIWIYDVFRYELDGLTPLRPLPFLFHLLTCGFKA